VSETAQVELKSGPVYAPARPPLRSVIVEVVVVAVHATGASPTRPLSTIVALHSQWVAVVIHRVQRIVVLCALAEKTQVRIAILLVA